MIKTFTGYSTDGLDLAVNDAEKDLNDFLSTHPAVVQQVTTTSQVSIGEYAASYWFTLTVVFTEARS